MSPDRIAELRRLCEQALHSYSCAHPQHQELARALLALLPVYEAAGGARDTLRPMPRDEYATRAYCILRDALSAAEKALEGR